MEHDDILDQLRDLRYPDSIDVTEAVMAQVRKRPYLQPVPVHTRRHRYVAAVASVLFAIVGAHSIYWVTDNYRQERISDMMVDIYDSHADYDYTAGPEYVELAAIDDFIYE